MYPYHVVFAVYHMDAFEHKTTSDNSREGVAKTERQIDRPNIPPGIVERYIEHFTFQTVQT